MQAQNQQTSIERLSKLQNQLQFIFRERSNIYDQLQRDLNTTTIKISESYIKKVQLHLKKYDKMRSMTAEIGCESIGDKNYTTENTKFWNLNQRIEREVEDKLRQLKDLDCRIDNYLNEQFDKCNQMQEIEQMIRKILSKKQPNHIHQAEPLFNEKKKCVEYLKSLKLQKEKVKQIKLYTVKQLLKLLEKLLSHREQRIEYCKNKRINKDSSDILNNLIKDLQQIQKGRHNGDSHDARLKKLHKNLDFMQQRIRKLSLELTEVFKEQQQTAAQIKQISINKAELSYFQQTLLGFVGIKSKDIPSFVDKCNKFISRQQQKQKELIQILQGIETTNQTIEIFEQINHAIQNQNYRKRQLLQRLEKLQADFQRQTVKQEQISQIESEMEKIRIRKTRLIKKMSSKADQADVNSYKNIHDELQSLQVQIKSKVVIINDMKKQLSEKAKRLYEQTNTMNDEFNDILSEVVPQVWFRDNDFTKEEAIRDLNLYLVKTFNRLSLKQ